MPVAQKRLWSEHETARILDEVFDSEKCQVVCSAFPNGKHHPTYVASNKMPLPIGCVNCWKAYYLYLAATTPPHLRRERIEAAYRATMDAVASFESGEFDFEPLAKPEIIFEKDALDDETGVYTSQKPAA